MLVIVERLEDGRVLCEERLGVVSLLDGVRLFLLLGEVS